MHFRKYFNTISLPMKTTPFFIAKYILHISTAFAKMFLARLKMFHFGKIVYIFIQEKRKKYFCTFLFTILLSHSHVSRPLITAIQLNTSCIAKMIPFGANQGNKQILHCFLAAPKSTNFSFSSFISLCYSNIEAINVWMSLYYVQKRLIT